MSNFNPKKPWAPNIILLTDEQYADPAIRRLISIILWCLIYQNHRLSRRTVPDWIADIFRDALGKAVRADGTAYKPHDIDDILNTGLDGDNPWLREVFSWALDCPEQHFYTGTLERIRLLHTTILLAGPIEWRKCIVRMEQPE